jgi:hypothetical protein
MNAQAEKHLGRAEGFLARGDEFYAKAADEIIAAREADPSLTYDEISERFGKGLSWLKKIVAWRTSGEGPTPFAEPDREHRDVRGARRVLGDAPIEQVEAMIEALPAERVAKIAQAALSKPDIARTIANDPDATAAVTRASGRVWEEAAAANRRASRPKKGSVRGVIGFLVEVLGGLNGAKRQLNDSYSAARDHELDDEQREAIEEGLAEITTIVDWFRSYLASGDQSFEDELAKILSD